MTQPASDSGSWDQDESPLEPAEMLDGDELGSTDAGRDPLGDSWDAPDRPSRSVQYPTTPREERQGATFDRLLSAELPDTDPYLEAERRETGQVLEADAFGEGSTAATDDDGGRRRARSDRDGESGWAEAAEHSALHLE
ncbi:hypothetical protein [Frankia sp. AgB32]|uniref:hypothetical protein n=1 Tax=Frankia sp. AgB32 TaxID=631119 RepID=UPI00200E34C4|nr:hypothetical protein [Frankia sp. AgB32]MCK9893351.1 hypothetical protein [Frankia sp. AgB32]